MPEGEQMFKYHGYSGPCPKPPLPKRYSFDPACMTLAEHFLPPQASDRLKKELAQRVQTAVEDFMESERDRLAKGLIEH